MDVIDWWEKHETDNKSGFIMILPIHRAAETNGVDAMSLLKSARVKYPCGEFLSKYSNAYRDGIKCRGTNGLTEGK